MNDPLSVTNAREGWDVVDYGKSIVAMEFLFVNRPDVNDGADGLLL